MSGPPSDYLQSFRAFGSDSRWFSTTFQQVGAAILNPNKRVAILDF
jgi:hypothetical protein